MNGCRVCCELFPSHKGTKVAFGKYDIVFSFICNECYPNTICVRNNKSKKWKLIDARKYSKDELQHIMDTYRANDYYSIWYVDPKKKQEE